eukprot:3038111-Amphidinium_carterae.1
MQSAFPLQSRPKHGHRAYYDTHYTCVQVRLHSSQQVPRDKNGALEKGIKSCPGGDGLPGKFAMTPGGALHKESVRSRDMSL